MNKDHKEKLLKVNKELIQEAKGVIASQFNTGRIGAPIYVDLQTLHRWWGKVKSFSHQLGPAVMPWKDSLSTDPKANTLAFSMSVLGTLEAIQHELENDLFETFTSLVKAETLADLLDQAAHLFGEGYHLAAGVLGRAVLEEHLRTVCSALECSPQKKRPTIADFNQALYGENHYTKVRMKQVDMLAAIGNDAAHNSPSLAAADVKKLCATYQSCWKQLQYNKTLAIGRAKDREPLKRIMMLLGRNMRLIKQIDDPGCGIACIAALLDIEYQTVKDFTSLILK